jgi:hypothetical protein
VATGPAQRIHVSDDPDRLCIAVPILPLPARLLLSVVLVVVYAGLFYLKGPRPGIFILIALTAPFALVLGWGSSCTTVTAQKIVSGFQIGPIPLRGRAFTRNGRKPVVILEGFVREQDAASAARTLAGRLNGHRPAQADPVTFTGD